MNDYTDIFSPDRLRDLWEQAGTQLGQINVAVFGKTGAGKSTLINEFFGEEVAETGIGEPITKEQCLYLHQSGRLGILDGPGVEVGVNSERILTDLRSYINRMRAASAKDQIHVAWYCVRALDRRFEDVEADFIRKLRELGLPVIVVLTQVPIRDGMIHPDVAKLAQQIISRKLPIDGPPIPIMAKADEFAGYPQHGLVDLLNRTEHAVPAGVKEALIAEQKVDLAAKAKQSRKIVGAAATTAAAAGASPLPFADAIPITGAQILMMMKIAHTYNLRFDKASIAAVAGPAAAMSGGKAAVGGLIKLIPGAGSIVGGTINASVAATITLAMGLAWITVCEKLATGNLNAIDGALDNDLVKQVFQEQFKKRLKLGRKALEAQATTTD